MSRTARLAAYAAILGLLFGGGAALGAAAGPDPRPTNSSSDADHGDSTEAPMHESDH